MKTMIANSRIKDKCKTMPGVIRNFDFFLYFDTAYMIKYPLHVTSTQGIAQNALYIT